MLNVGASYTERIVIDDFINQINTTGDQGVKEILTKLCQLYGLSTIEQHKGWYLEADYMKGVKTKAIRRMVDKLCYEVRQDVEKLVDAFEIPDSCLSAPIAFSFLG